MENQNFLERRDVCNFLRLRTAHPGDDPAIAELLVRSFHETYLRKLPDLETPPGREGELRDVHSRRQNGVVRVMELGFQIIGTYSLILPESTLDDSWTPLTATLRCLALDPDFHSLKLSEVLLRDAVAIAERWRVRNVCLHVQCGAEGVARLYRRFGFQRAEAGDKICYGNAVEGYLLTLKTAVVTTDCKIG